MSEVLSFERQIFAERFGRYAFRVDHRLSDHPLLSVDAVAELADFLPRGQVEHNLGDVPTVLADSEGALQSLDLNPGEIARGIETNGCWMVLKGIEDHPDYSRLLSTTLDEIEGHVAEQETRMRKRMGFIFLSAPGSVTPAHIDNEHNLLLQVRGTKEMNVGSFEDRAYYERELERLYAGRGTRYLENAPDSAETFPLKPGDGVYVPISAPHWVRNGETVSVSLSITFQTARSERRAHVYALNARLRRLRLSPRPPEQSPAVDWLKDTVWGALRLPVRVARAIRTLRRWFHRSRP